MIATRPENADATVRECADLGIKHVWMHGSFGGGSVSEPAARFGRERGIRVIEGGCPLMFAPTGDPAHTLVRYFCRLLGKLPSRVE